MHTVLGRNTGHFGAKRARGRGFRTKQQGSLGGGMDHIPGWKLGRRERGPGYCSAPPSGDGDSEPQAERSD
jgi:hypothetical protein